MSDSARQKKTGKQPPPPSAAAPQDPHLRFGRIAQTLINTMPLGVIVFDHTLTITDSNPLARELFPLKPTIPEVLEFAQPTTEESWKQRLEHALPTGETAVWDNVAYTHKNRRYALRLMVTPLPAEETGQQRGGLLLVEDTTARRAMEEDLAAAERLAAVGKLAARVAHELNNPLDGILRYLNLALRTAEHLNERNVNHYLHESRKGLLRMVEIIGELLEFSRSTYSAFQEADVNKIVEDAIKTMGPQAIEKQIKITRHYGKLLPNVRSGNLFQVFCNLIKNAVDAMESKGRLDITTHITNQDLIIDFVDTGPGITPDVLPRLFEPFFTTKAPGKGTGLGLAICKDIVARYGGQISAKNRDANGALFRVSIPLERTAHANESTTG